MPELSVDALDDIDGIVSDLAYWVGASDSEALLQMTQGLGAALATSATMRSAGSPADTIALVLAERASELQAARSAQHPGWLLLSLKLELMQHATAPTPLPYRKRAEGLLEEVDLIKLDLIRRGTMALANC